MALDVYLQISDITGESTDEKHRGWIECKSAGWAMKQPKSASSSTSGGHTAERCEHTGVSVTKLVDLASPSLMQALSSGKTHKKATLEFYRADGKENRIMYFAIEMEDVLVSEFGSNTSEGNFMTEHLTLLYGRVKWKYTKQKTSGGAEGGTVGGWDLCTNQRI